MQVQGLTKLLIYSRTIWYVLYLPPYLLKPNLCAIVQKPRCRHPTNLILKTALPNDLLPGVPRVQFPFDRSIPWTSNNHIYSPKHGERERLLPRASQTDCFAAAKRSPCRRLIMTITTSLSQHTCIAQSAGREFGSFSWVATAHLRYPTVEDP